MEKGDLFVVSAPSGAGKTTLCRKLLTSLTKIAFSVSHTTRPPRPGEEQGKDYYFISMKEFQEMLSRGEFLESNLVHENYYGTSKQEVLYRLKRGEDVVLDIDVQGAIQIKALFSDAVMIFILPPSWEALVERLLKRGSEVPEDLKIRLKNAKEEINHLHEYDYIVVNDNLEKALEELKSIVIARRSKASRVISSGKTSKILAGLPK